LGILDEDDRPTALYMPLRLSVQRRLEALRQSAALAYPGLVDHRGAPRRLSDDEIHDHFVEHRGLRGQMADKATRFYRNLVTVLESDRATQPAGSTPAPAPRENGRRVPSVSHATSRLVPLESSDAPPILVNLSVPNDATERELVELFRRVRRA